MNPGDRAYEAILVDVRNAVAYITLNRPDALNARNPVLIDELMDAYARAAVDPAVRVVVLSGAGDRAFSVGLDLKSPRPEESVVEARINKDRRSDTEALFHLGKPTIAAVHGYTLGGGLEMALACDLRIAADDARIGSPELKRGLIPGSGATQRLARLIGPSRTLELLYTGRQLTAQEAYDWGLVSKVVARDELLVAATSLAEEIAEMPPLAVRFARDAVYRGLDVPLAVGLSLERDLAALVRTSEDYAEGIAAFREKRRPTYRGR